MDTEAASLLKHLLKELETNGFILYREVDRLFRDPEAGRELDALLSGLERSGAQVVPDARLYPADRSLAGMEDLETEGGEPLRMYLQEVALVPSVEEAREVQLFQTLENSPPEMFLLKKELVEANLALVVSIAKGYRLNGIHILDLIEGGNVGLFHAVDSFRPQRGYRFSTYATLWIHRVLDELIRGGSDQVGMS
jgi:RNA polymerase primary sigma factor